MITRAQEKEEDQEAHPPGHEATDIETTGVGSVNHPDQNVIGLTETENVIESAIINTPTKEIGMAKEVKKEIKKEVETTRGDPIETEVIVVKERERKGQVEVIVQRIDQEVNQDLQVQVINIK